MEQRALKTSALGNLFMAAIGIGFGLVAGSDAIMLDGFFSLVGFVVALLTIRVAAMVNQPDDVHFHFGYASFEPALNSVRGLILLFLAVYALVTAVGAILDGGRDLVLGWAIVYAVVASAGCFALSANSRRAAKKSRSPLLAVDARSWMVDGAMSGGVALAFLAAWLLSGSRWSHLVPYVDPALVVLMVIAVIGMPIGVMRTGLGELLMAAPDAKTQEDVTRRFNRGVQEFGLTDLHLRMLRLGRSFFVLAHARIPEDADWSVTKLDDIRASIDREMEGIDGIDVDVLFTADDRWAHPVVEPAVPVEPDVPAPEGPDVSADSSED